MAGDGPTLAVLDGVEPAKRQPNLLFGALRWHDVDVTDPAVALSWLAAHPDAALDLMRARRTQTNEVARCATLLPVLALLPPPLALVEVGASSGLCLLYDAWRYHYTGPGIDHRVGVTDSPVELPCVVDADVPLPATVPAIVWRVGLDLAPVDARDPDARRWLGCLVWPEHHDRAQRLAAALDVAAAVAPTITAGDLVDDLAAVLDRAPAEATVVVLHSATLAYVDPDRRAAFVDLLARRGVHRLGAEALGVLPFDLPGGLEAGGAVGDRFVVSLDDRPLALAQPHGRSLTWLPG